MNAERRKELNHAIELVNDAQSNLEEAANIIESCRGEEEEYMDNMPENLQESDRYYRAEEAIESMENAEEVIQDILSTIEDAANSLDEATS